MHTLTEKRKAESGKPPSGGATSGGDKSEKLTRGLMIEMLWRGFGYEGQNPESFGEYLESRSDEQLAQMVAMLNATASSEEGREPGSRGSTVEGRGPEGELEGRGATVEGRGPEGDRDAAFLEFERLTNASIEELVVARIHAGEDNEAEEAAECLTAVELNLGRLKELAAGLR